MAEPVQPGTQPTWDSTQANLVPVDTSHKNNGYGFNELPASNMWNGLFNLVGQWIAYFTALLPYWLGANANEALTIASSIVVPTQANSTFQTAGGTVTQASMTNFKAGRIWTVFGNGSNATTLDYGTGGSGAFNLAGGLNATLTATNDAIAFQANGTTGNWDEVWRSTTVVNKPAQAIAVLTTPGAGSVTVPFGKTGALYRMVGGGGAGGAGYGASGTGGGGGGGSAGVYQMGVLTGLDGGASLNYQVGAGGTFSTAPTATWIGSSATQAAGGVNGTGGSGSSGEPGGTAVAATVSATMFGISSAAGAAGSNGGGSNGGAGGAGGASTFPALASSFAATVPGAAGGTSGGAGSTGTNGLLYGGGGSGGGGGNNTAPIGEGGNGASGILIIEWT